MKIFSHIIVVSMLGVLLLTPSALVFALGNAPSNTKDLLPTVNTVQKIPSTDSIKSAKSFNALQDIHDQEEARRIAAQTPTTFSDVVSNVIGLINQIIPVLIALAMVFFMWSCVQYIRQSGEGGSEARGNVLWGIIALFVLFSVWGLVNILCVTLLGASCGS